MAKPTDADAEDSITVITGGVVYHIDDERPPREDIEEQLEQRENESVQDFNRRVRSKSRGKAYRTIYLHDSGWVKCEGRHAEAENERGFVEVENWYPPHRIEMIE